MRNDWGWVVLLQSSIDLAGAYKRPSTSDGRTNVCGEYRSVRAESHPQSELDDEIRLLFLDR